MASCHPGCFGITLTSLAWKQVYKIIKCSAPTDKDGLRTAAGKLISGFNPMETDTLLALNSPMKSIWFDLLWCVCVYLHSLSGNSWNTKCSGREEIVFIDLYDIIWYTYMHICLHISGDEKSQSITRYICISIFQVKSYMTNIVIGSRCAVAATLIAGRVWCGGRCWLRQVVH